MGAERWTIDPRYLRAFGTWFNVDLIESWDETWIAQTAATMASSCPGDPEEIGAAFARALDGWSPEVVLSFVEASDVDWLADDEAEDRLRQVLSAAVAWAERQRR